MVGSLSTLPLPVPAPRRPSGPERWIRNWYENELGWATVPGRPVRLVVGRRFDVLDVPAEAGRAALRHLGPASPVAAQGGRMRLLVAAGSAQELPGLLRWLEWDGADLDLVALGEGALMEAPPPGAGAAGARPPARDRSVSQGAAVWVRPPGQDARSRPRCRRCRPWGARVAPPISHESWTRWQLSATGSGCGACAAVGRIARSRAPSACRRPGGGRRSSPDSRQALAFS